MNSLAAPLLASLFALASLAGCLGGGGGGAGDGATLDDDATPVYDSKVEAQADGAADTGTIAGAVVDEFGAPIEGALVTVAPANKTTVVTVPPASSDAEGAVTFSKVPAGTYSVTAVADGFDARNTAVNVLKDATAEFELKLPPLVVDDAFNVTTVFDGRVTCWVRIFLPGNICDVTDGPTVNQALGAAGKAWANNHRFGAGANADPPVDGRIVKVLVEVSWQEQKAGTSYGPPTPLGLTFVLTDAADGQNQNSTSNWHADSAPVPHVAFWKTELDAWNLTRAGNFTFFAYPSTLLFNDAGMDIAYEAHATVFYNRLPDPCWSPMRAGKVC